MKRHSSTNQTQHEPLGVSNDVLTGQLRQVLQPGTNITFDTSQPDFTLINAASGYPTTITSPQELDTLVLDSSNAIVNRPWTDVLESATTDSLTVAKVGTKIQLALAPHAKIYNAAVTYPSGQALAFVDRQGIAYATNANGRIESPRYHKAANARVAIESTRVSTGSNVARVPIELGRNAGAALLSLDTESANVPTVTNAALVNGVQYKKLNFSGAQTLVTPASSHDDAAAINSAWDCTLVLACELTPNDTTSQYVRFTGNSGVFSFSLGNSTVVGNLAITCGETHVVPYWGVAGVYVIRISQSSAFTSYLDVFFNGANIYSRPFSASVTAKSLGLAGLLRLGDATNSTSTMVLHHMSWYDYALDDSRCYDLTQYLATTHGLNALTISSDISSATNQMVRYRSALSATSSNWLPVSNLSIAAYELTQPVSGERPTYNTGAAYPTFNYYFSSAVTSMFSGILGATLGARNSIVFMFAPGGVSASLNDILTLTLNNNDMITVNGSYTGGILSLGLKSGATQKLTTLAHISGTNDECAVVLAKDASVYTLSVIRFDTRECASCALNYTGAGVTINRITVGRTSAAASTFPYNIGDMYAFPRTLSATDAYQLVDALTVLYNLPLTGTVLLTPR